MTPVHLALAAALVAVSPGAAPAAADTLGHVSEDVRYPSGPLTLAASLLTPRGPGGPHAAAVILQGSGTSGRDNPWARAIAEELVRAGLAVLLTDKRGSGESEGDWRTADFDDLASDALAGVEYLRGRSGIDPRRIGLVGLSQGGWVAPVAAARSPAVAFVIDVSGAAVGFAEQSYHEMANTARQAGLDDAHVQEVLDLNRAAGEYLATGDWAAYEQARAHGLRRPWADIARGFPGSESLPVWTFLRGVFEFDPMPYWVQVSQPVLVLYGEHDEHDNVPVAESVRRLRHGFGATGKRNFRIEVIPGAGHAFIDPDRQALMPGFTQALARWLRTTILTPTP